MASRENFGSKLGVILAAAGSAVGLGNIWRFPIETGQNGGAAYIIVYIACIIILGIPIMISEFAIGRRSRRNTAGAYEALAPGTQWKWIGRLGVFTGFIIFCYYTVVAGWTLEYSTLAIGNAFEGKSAEDYKMIFSEFAGHPVKPLIWMAVMFILTHIIIVKGVTSGIEKYSKLMMPALLIIVLILVYCSVTLPKASEGLDFLLKPDFSKITGNTILNAMGQAFFSLSLGLGCLCTYASYFSKETNLTKTALNVCGIDTFIAIMAGFIIFPAVFNAGYQLQPSDVGPSLIFITLPSIFQESFSQIPIVGYIFAVMFYLLLVVAALTSTISIHEVVNAYIQEEWHLTRSQAAWVVTGVCMFLGFFSCWSFGWLSDFKIFGMTVFDLFDFCASNIFLPVGGMLISIFTGWRLDKKMLKAELSNEGSLKVPLFGVYTFILKFIAPLAIGLVLLNQLGMFKFL